MAIGSWLTMEDIYANIYVLKCWREAEKVRHSYIHQAGFLVTHTHVPGPADLDGYYVS